MTPHPHPQAEILRAIADGKTIQLQHIFASDDSFEDVENPLEFICNKNYRFRIKHPTININGFEIQEPVREPLDFSAKYWVLSLSTPRILLDIKGGDIEDWKIQRGLVHRTKEAALAHAAALLSFTRDDK